MQKLRYRKSQLRPSYKPFFTVSEEPFHLISLTAISVMSSYAPESLSSAKKSSSCESSVKPNENKIGVENSAFQSVALHPAP